jgi:cold shock CspA family protein
MAIIVNEHLVTTREEIDYFKKTLRRIDVRFIFIQSKTSEKFEMGPLGNFLFGVRSFFEKTSPIPANVQVRNLRALKEYIYDQSLDMNTIPTCELFYATTGSWTRDKILEGRVDAELQTLRTTQLFSDVKFTWLDGETLKKYYRELRNKVVKQITFDKHTSLPVIQGVLQAYIGVLPAREYLRLITDDDGYLRRNLFYDNVRDYQGNNPVNQEIATTVTETSYNDLFSLLNNGITVVAKSITQVGSAFTVRDYQVVNGCQTSHVLYLNRSAVTDQIFVPLKLIVTDDVEITNKITRATNRQTAVLVEAFSSLQPFHKQLEEFYNSFKAERPLYYERRSKQYEGFPIPPNQIISIPIQTQSFLAMFLNEPHSTHRYYGELLRANEGKMFIEGHHPYPYYISGYAMYLLQKLFQAKQISPKYKVFRYHMLMIFRLLVEETALPFLNSNNKKMEKYCSDLRVRLWSETEALSDFQKATSIVDEVLEKSPFGAYESARRKAFTEELITLASSGKQPQAVTVQRETGVVKSFSELRGYGFIRCETRGQDIFVHYSDIRGEGFRYLVPNDLVDFIVVKTDKGANAKDVVVLEEQMAPSKNR